jgi:hypothetical protein
MKIPPKIRCILGIIVFPFLLIFVMIETALGEAFEQISSFSETIKDTWRNGS